MGGKAGSCWPDAKISDANNTQKKRARNLRRLKGGAFLNSRNVGYSLAYSAKVTTAATSATRAAICAASLDVPGNTNDGITTSNAIKRARTADPMIRLTTLVSLQIGWARYDAATLFQICAAGLWRTASLLPQFCPSSQKGSTLVWAYPCEIIGFTIGLVRVYISRCCEIWQLLKSLQNLVGAKKGPPQRTARSCHWRKGSHPGARLCCLSFKAIDGRRFFHGQANIVQAVHQAVLFEAVEFKGKALAIRTGDSLVLQIDSHPRI